MRDYSSYTGVNVSSKIKRDAERMLEKSLNGYTYFECIIAPNGDFDRQFSANVQIFQRYDSDGESLKIIGRIGEIERGNYVLYDNQTWLITSKPEDNGIYRKAIMELCSVDMPLRENDKEVIVGLDKYGRPIVEVVPGKVVMLPCVPKFNDASTSIADTNEPINELANIITVRIPYRESPSIQHDERFSVWKESYRIIRIDPSKSINGIGILKITAERLGKGEF